METTANTEFVKDDPKRLWIGLFCFLTATTGAVLLYRDYKQGYESTGEVLATIERKDLRVRKRPSTTYIWSEAQQNEDVRKKEYVQTGEGSGAIVKFSNGKVLELGENSLIFVDNIDDLSLSFIQGTGLVKVDGKDTKITKDETGKTKIEELSVQLNKPNNLDTFLSKGAQTEMEFSWSIQGNEKTDAMIELSSSPEFKGKITRVASAPASDTKLKLKPGKYYWRVALNGVPASAIKQFNIIDLVSLDPISPKNTSLAILGPKTQVKFKWNTPSSVIDPSQGKCTIEISDDEEFKNPRTVEIDPNTGFTTLQQFEKGRFFWRIKTAHLGQHVFGDVAKLEIKTIDQIDLKFDGLKEGSIVQSDPKKPLQVSWTSSISSEEVHYELKFKDKVISTKETVTAIADTTPGYYSLSLEAKVNDRVIGEIKPIKISLLNDATIKVNLPEDKKRYEYQEDVPEVKFSWDRDSLVEQGYHYVLEISDSEEFQKIIETDKLANKTETSYTPKIKAGRQFWRVKLLNPSQQVMKVSAVRQFELQPFPPPEPPVQLGLEGGAEEFKLEESGQTPTLVWTQVERAKKYEVQVYQMQEDQKDSKLILEKEVSETKLKLGQLDEASYRFSVKSIDSHGRKGKASEFSKFKVNFGDMLPAPESLTEEVQ